LPTVSGRSCAEPSPGEISQGSSAFTTADSSAINSGSRGNGRTSLSHARTPARCRAMDSSVPGASRLASSAESSAWATAAPKTSATNSAAAAASWTSSCGVSLTGSTTAVTPSKEKNTLPAGAARPGPTMRTPSLAVRIGTRVVTRYLPGTAAAPSSGHQREPDGRDGLRLSQPGTGSDHASRASRRAAQPQHSVPPPAAV
jgi:hypothetical protein